MLMKPTVLSQFISSLNSTKRIILQRFIEQNFRTATVSERHTESHLGVFEKRYDEVFVEQKEDDSTSGPVQCSHFHDEKGASKHR